MVFKVYHNKILFTISLVIFSILAYTRFMFQICTDYQTKAACRVRRRLFGFARSERSEQHAQGDGLRLR
jgi:hypothetical protein